ncbi:MAG: multidrug effflux MFS transporter [Muribaculaceae bacterium]|nr:multidrug effflux MFS transporter [Muribaculaceae bacterium]
MSKGYYIFLLTLLGLLCGFGPFVTDMYLPTLPSMTEVFHTSPSMVQLGLTMSMLGLAVGQLFFGPISDRYGRKKILMSALLLFALATVGIIYSKAMDFFNLCRFVQGLGGAGAIVLSRSVATDCFSGRELAKAMALIGAVNGIAPVSAPVVGGLVAESIGWQGIFWILLGLGLALAICSLWFRESLPDDRRIKDGYGPLVRSFTQLFKIRYFVFYVVLSGFANGVLFSYISSASFIIQNHFGYSELIFSLVFAVNAIGIGLGSALAIKFKTLRYAMLTGAIIMSACGLLQFIGIICFNTFTTYEVTMLLIVLGLGLVFSSSTTLAMDEGRQSPGSASAIFGAVGFLFGGMVSPLVGIGDILRTSSVLIIICSAICLLLSIVCLRCRK